MPNSARAVDLRRMSWIAYRPDRCPLNLSARAKRWFWFFQGLAQLHYKGIRAPIGALVDAEQRSAGQTGSERTAYRAIGELEIAGLISRPRKPAGCIEITFQPGLFVSYISTPLPKCQTSDLPISPEIRSARRTNHGIQNQIADRISQPEKKSRSPHLNDASHDRSLLPCARPTPPAAPIRRQPPPLFSCRKVAAQVDRPAVLALAAAEYADRRRRRPTRSGIDWNRETDRWQLMTISEREHVARLELLPALRSALSERHPDAPDLDDEKTESPGCPELPDLDVGYVLAPRLKVDRPPPVELRLDLAAGDLAILLAARDRIRRTG